MATKATKSNHSESQLIAENLRALLKVRKSTESEVAEALEIPVMTIRRLVSGETTDPRVFTLKLIADHFNVSIDTLIKENKMTAGELVEQSQPVFMPILDWTTIEKVNSIQEINLKTWQKWHQFSFNHDTDISEHAFALESRPSMYPRFHPGTIFIIDPDASPIDGDIVLVRIKKNNEITLRELNIDAPLWKLRSVVSESNCLEYSRKNHEIAGVVLLTLLYNRKL